MTTVPYDTVRYNQIQQKASHNSYQRSEALADQIAYWRLRCVELDIHNGNTGGGWPPLAGDWYVYHASVVDQSSSVYRLSDGLAMLAGFHAAVPDHEVMTIALDLKDHFDRDHTPDDLDALIRSYLGDALFTAADLLGDHPDLQSAARAGWPLLKDLRGKFIFICTTGDLSDPDSQLNEYVSDGATANTRVGFVAPEITSTSQIAAKNYAVFFNMSAGDVAALAPAVYQQGFVSRSYGADSSGDWTAAVQARNHIIATDDVNADEDPWARTDNALGWPFQGNGITVDPATAEPGVVIGLEVSSSDIWGSSDSCGFYYDACTDSPDHTYTFAVAVPGSHVEDWAKVGLMARSSLAADAANFCVLRPAASNPVRVQVRASDGRSTTATSLSTPPSITDSGWMLLRLQISGGGTIAEGFASFDGTHWTSIARQTFSSPLLYQGLVASSHGTKETLRFLAIPVGGPTAFAAKTNIGTDSSMVVFSGVYPPSGAG